MSPSVPTACPAAGSAGLAAVLRVSAVPRGARRVTRPPASVAGVDRGRPGPSGPPPPRAPPSTGPFEPMAWPPAGDAPCDQPAAPDAAHGPYAARSSGSARSTPHTVASTCASATWPSAPRSPRRRCRSTTPPGSRAGSTRPAGSNDPTEVNGTGPFRLGRGRERHITLAAIRDVLGSPGCRRPRDLRWATTAANGCRSCRGLGRRNRPGRSGRPRERRRRPRAQLLPRPGLNTSYIGMNNRFAPFDNEVVRQAIAMGIDRGALVDAAFPAGTELATHFMPCAIPYGCAGDSWANPTPRWARDLLADAGFPDGFETTITYSDEPRDYLPDPTATAAALQRRPRPARHHGDVDRHALRPARPTLDAGRLDGLYLLGCAGQVSGSGPPARRPFRSGCEPPVRPTVR